MYKIKSGKMIALIRRYLKCWQHHETTTVTDLETGKSM